jgi:hypothetical protein
LPLRAATYYKDGLSNPRAFYTRKLIGVDLF